MTFKLNIFIYFTGLILVTCTKSPSDPKTVTFSGTVTLEGKTDFSGVKVSLYKPVELDTALVRINQEYPNIGVQISQETEFDHREHTPSYSTTTNANGAWKIENVPPGTYNVVAEKDSFGWQYKYEVSENNENLITLFKIEKLTGRLDNNKTLLKNHCYYLNDNYIIESNGKLIIEDGVRIICKNNSRMTVYGLIERIFAGEFSEFTGEILNPGNWEGIKIESTVNDFTYIVFSYASTGLSLKHMKSHCENLYFKNNTTGLTILTSEEQDSVKVKNSIFTKNISGIRTENVDNLIIKNCVLKNNTNYGLYLFRTVGGIINSLFESSEYGIYTEYGTNMTVEYCRFKNNENEDYGAYSAHFKINSCEFFPENTGIRILQFWFGEAPTGELHNNAFYGIQQVFNNERNPNNVDATQNWWNSTTVHIIEERILDKNDFDPTDPKYEVTGIVDYSNFYNTIPNNIGIQ